MPLRLARLRALHPSVTQLPRCGRRHIRPGDVARAVARRHRAVLTAHGQLVRVTVGGGGDAS